MQYKLILLVVGLFQASLAYPYADGESVPHPSKDVAPPDTQDSSTQTEVTTQKGWIKQGVETITGMIKGQADIAKDAVGIAGTGTHMGAKITSAAGELGTGIGNAALQGGLQIGAMGVEAGANLAHQGIGLVDKWGQILPGFLGKGVQSVANLAGNIVDKAENIGKGVLEKVGAAGDKGFKWVDSKIKDTANSVDTTVNHITGKIQEGIDKGANTLTGGIDNTLGKLKDIVNNIRPKPVTA
uniref:Venom hemolysin-like protein 1 n=1 Tax=Platymeris rhadamanthus TaxID=1134088 RepID=HLP1_PLARH|nr:RecName: Full=Venom hemolysin-like protein 1; Flags: Precursor [Platymeris rhadamanthus]QHB21508.1 venom hemolysin-like protein 1 [Platymeris rhadamanthus]